MPLLAQTAPPDWALLGILAAIAAVCLFVSLRLLAELGDRDRIRRRVEERGGVVQSLRKNPGGDARGRHRSYTIDYVVAGRRHRATCTTIESGGLLWTEDRIVRDEREDTGRGGSGQRMGRA